MGSAFCSSVIHVRCTSGTFQYSVLVGAACVVYPIPSLDGDRAITTAQRVNYDDANANNAVSLLAYRHRGVR